MTATVPLLVQVRSLSKTYLVGDVRIEALADVSLAAGIYPARRAARVDPVVALRHD